MNSEHKNNKGFFEIARESASLSFEDFCTKYYEPELPVIIDNIGSGWPAKDTWTESYIRQKLSNEPTAKTASLWYWMERDTLNSDYSSPEVIDKLLDSNDVFPRNEMMRIWIHNKGNVSSWHYDANMVNVFNVQVTGQKEWYLVSPDTPLACYPFTSFAVMDGNDKRNIRNKIYTNAITNAGDLLYIPPLWFHKIISHGEENINLNWIFTKKETKVTTKTLRRELQRYHLQSTLSQHRYQWVQKLFKDINEKIPGYLRWKWRYPEMIKTPEKRKLLGLTRHTLGELSVLAKVLRHYKQIQPYIDNIKMVEKFDKA